MARNPRFASGRPRRVEAGFVLAPPFPPESAGDPTEKAESPDRDRYRSWQVDAPGDDPEVFGL